MLKETTEERNIIAYAHCGTCHTGTLAFGWTKEGFKLWCENCDKQVVHYDLLGNKVKSI